MDGVPEGSPPATTGHPGATAPVEAWLTAVDQHRDVAKWLIAAFGAIGAVVVAGIAPLAKLASRPPERMGFVVAGGVVALLGVTAVLTAATSVLIPQSVHWHQLQARRRGWFRRTLAGLGNLDTLLAEHPGDVLPPGIHTVDQLDEAIRNLRRSATAAATEARALTEDDPSRPRFERAARALRSAVASHQRARQQLLAMARYERGRTRFNASLVAVFAGGALTAAGFGLTLYGLGAGDTAPESTRSSRSDPLPVVISLTPDGASALAPRLGPRCDVTRIDALLVGGDPATEPWEVVTLPTQDCRALRFTLTTDLGTLG